MNCPECDCRMAVVKTMVLPGQTLRMQECACGIRCESAEKVIRRLPVAPATVRQPARNGPGAAGNPPATAGGVGGGLPSGSVQGSLPDPNCDPDQEVITPSDQTRVRAHVDYPIEFENLWERTGKRGTKLAARKAWEKAGNPSWVQVQEAWRAYLLSDRPVRLGAIKDLSTWLNGDCHKQEWPPAQTAINGVRQPARTQQNLDVAQRFLERHGRTPE